VKSKEEEDEKELTDRMKELKKKRDADHKLKMDEYTKTKISLKDEFEK
jgi:hypothetical protein